MELKIILPLLRQNFEMELDTNVLRDASDAQIAQTMACYDRALSHVLLGLLGNDSPQAASGHKGPKPGSQAAKARAEKAAQTRSANRQREAEESMARTSNIESAKSGESGVNSIA